MTLKSIAIFFNLLVLLGFLWNVFRLKLPYPQALFNAILASAVASALYYCLGHFFWPARL